VIEETPSDDIFSTSASDAFMEARGTGEIPAEGQMAEGLDPDVAQQVEILQSQMETADTSQIAEQFGSPQIQELGSQFQDIQPISVEQVASQTQAQQDEQQTETQAQETQADTLADTEAKDAETFKTDTAQVDAIDAQRAKAMRDDGIKEDGDEDEDVGEDAGEDVGEGLEGAEVGLDLDPATAIIGIGLGILSSFLPGLFGGSEDEPIPPPQVNFNIADAIGVTI
jgi:hypothetical protein